VRPLCGLVVGFEESSGREEDKVSEEEEDTWRVDVKQEL
jgi:hypothetical protein